MIKRTADFLGKFSDDKELKHLLHTEETEVFPLIVKARLGVSELEGLIPEHLYNLVSGFLYGPEWEDYTGNIQRLHLGSNDIVDWCKSNPGMHIMDPQSPFFDNLWRFKDSIRTYRNLPTVVELAKQSAPSMNIDVNKKVLKRIDMYVDVGALRRILERIFSTMSDPRFSGPVMISAENLDPQNGYKVARLVIEQKNSYQQPSLEFIKDRLNAGAGDLGSLKKLIDGVAYWSIESDWEEGSARCNVTSPDIFMQQFERLDEPVGGFRHVLTFYHKTI